MYREYEGFGRGGDPIGLGGELRENAQIAPAERVKNKVYWVNGDMQLPFDLRRGAASDLGLFLTTQSEQEKVYDLEVHPYHNRSSMLERVVFRDNEGRLYRDVDLKGTGNLVSIGGKMKNVPLQGEQRAATGPLGIAELGYAKTDRDVTEQFLRKGIRTYRIVAIIELQELIDGEGTHISVDEAKARGYLHDDETPIVEVRAFGTKMRVRDAYNRSYVEDAKKIVAAELGVQVETDRDYVDWFVSTLAKEAAKIHKAGYLHRYLNAHNITLDCRIVDLDSVYTRAEAGDSFEALRVADVKDAFSAIVELAKLGLSLSEDEIKHAANNFVAQYKREYAALVSV
jgi:hypothetical protein